MNVDTTIKYNLFQILLKLNLLNSNYIMILLISMTGGDLIMDFMIEAIDLTKRYDDLMAVDGLKHWN